MTTRKPNAAPIVINLFFAVLSAAILAPLLLVVAISLSSEESLLHNGYRFIPAQWDTFAYEIVLRNPLQLLQAYQVTIGVTVIGTACALLMTTMAAYAVSRRDYRYRRPTMLFIVFTMLFNGGLVPFYILVTQYLQLKDTLGALIVPYLVSPFYLLIMKGFLEKLPVEIFDSAKIDGASEWRIFLRIVLPLSTPALATVGLFISFAYWNDWWLGLLFINEQHLVPLQLLLYRIMDTIEFISANMDLVNVNLTSAQFPSLSTRMAMAVLAAGPMMFVFPMFQRYFVAGLTVGSVKS
ncbi:carbohydrate ABC transporter permease [Paenibacillus agaridevorans]|uniref:carbohydrate ABC transporter permease n=1 Tax=Paenibacillus agaridevorans TaxID=171404 RepID=UPI001BE43908|nr:carbohydrate ABC transporter permease [Paenibacillus agaridevorans]